ncbi:putative transcription factor [Vitis vinifera]|uniref:Putative transcription factor n=1 Tax=Vitis vinifera TaxID=29760 RepID=A0A438DVC9_VITVI|nr:putative transcription factor [Vitis vinifera]
MEMVKESVRKCSHCGNNGHNSRTCSAGGKGCLKLFGVQILTEKEDEAMRKSLSMGNLQSCNIEHHHGDAGGAWSEEEHRTFLAGLEKLGKGDWRGIAKKFVTTRTPTQVASHAQKYFSGELPVIKGNAGQASLTCLWILRLNLLRFVQIHPRKGMPISFHRRQVNISAHHVVNPMSSLQLEAHPILPMAACGVPYMCHELSLFLTRVALRQVKTLDLAKSTLLPMLSLLGEDAPDLEALRA